MASASAADRHHGFPARQFILWKKIIEKSGSWLCISLNSVLPLSGLKKYCLYLGSSPPEQQGFPHPVQPFNLFIENRLVENTPI